MSQVENLNLSGAELQLCVQVTGVDGLSAAFGALCIPATGSRSLGSKTIGVERSHTTNVPIYMDSALRVVNCVSLQLAAVVLVPRPLVLSGYTQPTFRSMLGKNCTRF